MKVRELLSDRSRWTTQVVAKNAQGKAVDVHDPSAVCWCLLGALEKCYPDAVDVKIKVQEEAHRRYNTYLLGQGVNDRLGYDAVMSLVNSCDV